MQLEKLGHLRTGFSYRSANIFDNPNGYLGFNVSAIDQRLQIDTTLLEPINFIEKHQKFQIQPGDILLPLRGKNMLAILVEKVPDRTIAFAQFAIFTPNRNLIDSRYLAWYLNHPANAEKRNTDLVQYSKINSINIKQYRTYSLDIPPIQKQRKIAQILEVREQERQLTIDIQKLEDLKIQQILSQVAGL